MAAVAPTIFSEDFNGLDPATGRAIGFQHTTTFSIANWADVSDLAGWSDNGVAGEVHVVDTANWDGNTGNARNSAVMIWHGGTNTVTMDNVIAGSNELGVEYQVDFRFGGAVFFDGAQFNDPTLNDSVVIDLLRGDDSVLTSHSEVAPEVVGSLDLGFESRSFTYTGDGSGDIRFRVTGSGDEGSIRFYGAIDDLVLSIPIGPVISGPFDIVHIDRAQETSEVTIEFTSVSGVTYAVLASTDLITWEIIDNAVMGTDDITAFTDAVFALASDGQAFYSVALLPPPRHFADDFETGAEGWTVTPTEGDTLWEMGMPNVDDLTNANSGLNAWGTNISGDYTPNSVASLRSPVIDLAELPRPRLTFNYFIDTVEGIEGGQLRFLDENGY